MNIVLKVKIKRSKMLLNVAADNPRNDQVTSEQLIIG